MQWRGGFFMQSLKCYFAVNFPACEAMGEICTKITLKRVHKQFHNGTIYIILCLTWHNEPINDYQKDDLHKSTTYLTNFLFVGDQITKMCTFQRRLSEGCLGHFPWSCTEMNFDGLYWWWINIGLYVTKWISVDHDLLCYIASQVPIN